MIRCFISFIISSVIFTACDPGGSVIFRNSSKDTVYLAYNYDSMNHYLWGAGPDNRTIFKNKKAEQTGRWLTFSFAPNDTSVLYSAMGAGFPDFSAATTHFFYAYKPGSTDTLFYTSYNNLKKRISRKTHFMHYELYLDIGL